MANNTLQAIRVSILQRIFQMFIAKYRLIFTLIAVETNIKTFYKKNKIISNLLKR